MANSKDNLVTSASVRKKGEIVAGEVNLQVFVALEKAGFEKWKRTRLARSEQTSRRGVFFFPSRGDEPECAHTVTSRSNLFSTKDDWKSRGRASVKIGRNQAKFTQGQSGTADEQQADRIPDQVTSEAQSDLPQACHCGKVTARESANVKRSACRLKASKDQPTWHMLLSRRSCTKSCAHPDGRSMKKHAL